MTDCKQLLQQRTTTSEQHSKTLSSHTATVTDDVSKLGYTTVTFVDLRVEADDLSQQLLPDIHHVTSEFTF